MVGNRNKTLQNHDHIQRCGSPSNSSKVGIKYLNHMNKKKSMKSTYEWLVEMDELTYGSEEEDDEAEYLGGD